MKTGLTQRFLDCRSRERGASSIATTAALSLAILISASGVYLGNVSAANKHIVQKLEPVDVPQYAPIEDSDHNGTPDWQDELAKSGIVFSTTTASASSSDALVSVVSSVAQSLYGGYLSLKQYNSYSPEKADELGQSVAHNIRAPLAFTPHTVNELSLAADFSEKSVLQYRAAMRIALAPIVTDDAPEFEIFARYIETKDPSWLGELGRAAERYRDAQKNVLALTIPKEVAPEHLRVANALGAYAESVEKISRPQDNALDSVALLKTLNESEQEMLYAFNALAHYYVRTVATK